MGLLKQFLDYREWSFKQEQFPPNLKKNKLRMSGIPYCARKLYFQKMGEPSNASDYLLQLAHEGNVDHKDLQNIAMAMADEYIGYNVDIESSTEILITTKHGVLTLSGRIDLSWYGNSKDHPKQYVLFEIDDIKSVSSRSWYYLKKDEDEKTADGYREHRDQKLLYMHSKIDEEGNPPIGCLWYKNRNDGSMIEKEVEYDLDRLQFLIDKSIHVFECIREETPPDKYSPVQDYECKSKSGRCAHYDLCYEKGRFICFRDGE